MAKMKNFMMDVEEFCDGYFYGDFRGAKFDFTAEEIAEDAEAFFHMKMAGDHANEYVKGILNAL